MKPGWHRQSYLAVIQFALLTGALLWLMVQGAESMGYNWQWYRVPRYLYRIKDGEVIWGPLMVGLLTTIHLSVISFGLTLVIGLGTAMLRLSSSVVGRAVARCYLELIRNTPILVQLYLFYFVLAPILGIDRWWTAILCLAVFEGSFASEIFRAGILSVPRGQWEASDSLGLPRRDAYRFVILPQAVRLMLPPMTSLAVSLIKHSSIVSVIAVAELTTEGRNIISETYMSFEIWFTVAALYLALTVSLSLFATYLERRLHAPA
ncbi:MAG: amino acid ABC transporter permease [Pseudomonadota bacterium]